VLERNLVNPHGEVQRGNPTEQRVEDDLQLRAGELLTDALMPAVAERDMLTGAQRCRYSRSGSANSPASQVAGARSMMMPSPAQMTSPAMSMSLRRDAALTVLDDRQIAQQLFDGIRNDLRVVGLA
jgi:hypothetical protein